MDVHWMNDSWGIIFFVDYYAFLAATVLAIAWGFSAYMKYRK